MMEQPNKDDSTEGQTEHHHSHGETTTTLLEVSSERTLPWWMGEAAFKFALNFGFNSVVVGVLLYMGNNFLVTIGRSIETIRDSMVRVETTVGEMKNLSNYSQTNLFEIQRHDREAKERDTIMLRLLEKICDCYDREFREKRPTLAPVPKPADKRNDQTDKHSGRVTQGARVG